MRQKDTEGWSQNLIDSAMRTEQKKSQKRLTMYPSDLTAPFRGPATKEYPLGTTWVEAALTA